MWPVCLVLPEQKYVRFFVEIFLMPESALAGGTIDGKNYVLIIFHARTGQRITYRDDVR